MSENESAPDAPAASPTHSLQEGGILSMLISGRIVAARDDFASSPIKPDSQVAPFFDWRESPVTDRRSLLVAASGRGAKSAG